MTDSSRWLPLALVLVSCGRAPAPAARPAAAAPHSSPKPSVHASHASPNAPVAAETPEERLARYRALWSSARHHPAALEKPAQPAHLALGAYACRVSREYKLRDCTVERDEQGRTWLEFAEGNLLGMRGLVSDVPGALAFEGWLTDEEPFGCSSCQDRCIAYPGSCACSPLPPEAVVECLQQPLRMTLRLVAPGRYRATLLYRVYYNEYVGEGPERHAQGYVAKEERLEIELIRRAP